jgi:hypothetical protein
MMRLRCMAMNVMPLTVLLMILMMMTLGGDVSVDASSISPSLKNKNLIISQQPSISNVVRDLLKYQLNNDSGNDDDANTGGDATIVVSCFITSRSVTTKQRKKIIREIVQLNDPENSDDDVGVAYKAMATSNGMVVLQPSTVLEAVQLVSSSSNNSNNHMMHSILYYPDPIDVQRGEGLMDTLGPVLESILQQQPSSSIYVMIPEGMESSFVQTQIEQSLQSLIPYFILDNSTASTVSDVLRSKIIYMSPSSVLEALRNNKSDNPITSEVLLRQMSSSSTTSTSHGIPHHNPFKTPQYLAASNRLRPVAQQQYTNIVAALQRTCFTTSSTSTLADTETSTSTDAQSKLDRLKFVPNLGELCDAIVMKEMAFWHDAAPDSSAVDRSLRQSMVGRQICEKVYDDVFMYLFTNIYTEQMNKLQKICYDTLKKDLSKLVISPNLPTDMNRIGQASISTFITDTVRLIPKTSFVSSYHTSYLTSYAVSAQRMYARKVLEYIQNRILLAKASGKFRPVPRKGITIGMHYLLPKPFGNDYRQEPSMIHATDHMVYIPKTSKLSDVNMEQVASGSSDWKDSLVPHPPGNDMLYMQ